MISTASNRTGVVAVGVTEQPISALKAVTNRNLLVGADVNAPRSVGLPFRGSVARHWRAELELTGFRYAALPSEGTSKPKARRALYRWTLLVSMPSHTVTSSPVRAGSSRPA